MLSDLRNLNDILKLPPLEFAIQDLLPKAGILVLAGTPKDGKSVVALDLVLRGVRGHLAFGRYKQSYKKVLVVNVEGRHQGIRMRDMMFEHETNEVRDKILVSGAPIHFTLPDGAVNHLVFKAFAERIASEGIELAILDPMVSFHTGDENNSQQMVALLDALRTVGEATKCGFILIHHTRKLSSMQSLEEAIEQGGNMLRGASGIFGAVDTAVLLWQTENKKRTLTFSCRYAKGDTSPVDLIMDPTTWRMYPIDGDVPDPNLWMQDKGGPKWQEYQATWNLSDAALKRAKEAYMGPRRLVMVDSGGQSARTPALDLKTLLN